MKTPTRSSSSLLRTAGRMARFGGWTIDLPARTLNWSDEVYEMLGYPIGAGAPGTLEARLDQYEANDRDRLAEAIDRCIEHGTPFDQRGTLADAHGRQLNTRSIGEAVWADGEIVAVQGALLDETASFTRAICDVDHEELGQRALEKAERSCRELVALLDVARDAIVVSGLDHAIRFWNRAASEMYGWSAEESVGRSIRELIYRNPAAFDLATDTTIRTGQWAGEVEQRTSDGRTIIANCLWSLHLDADGQPGAIYAVTIDVTETRRLEGEHRRNARLESLGSLAGGIAHDLNNVLTPILMAVELIQMPGADPADQNQLLDSITASVRRGGEMTTQVLAFASGVVSAHGVVDIRQVLDEAVEYAHRTVPGPSRFAVHLPPGLGFVLGDETQLLQVLHNLLSNARDAVEAGGDITLRADVVDNAGMPPRLEVRVSDSGTGIDPQYLATIFEPFVTTKPVGKGTGLGLSTARAIAVAHGGTLEVSSTPGEGATFTLSLPWLSDFAPDAEEARSLTDRLESRGELVLIVDDEGAVRELARHALETFGYATELAENGREALEVAERLGSTLDLVLIDNIMPLVSGRELAAQLTASHPGLPVIIMSGSAPGTVEPGTHVLRKPFTAERLLGLVRARLDGAPGISASTAIADPEQARPDDDASTHQVTRNS